MKTNPSFHEAAKGDRRAVESALAGISLDAVSNDAGQQAAEWASNRSNQYKKITALIVAGDVMTYVGWRASPLGIVLVLFGIPTVLYGCYLWTKMKDRHWAFMLWGLLCPIGLLGISLLRDKSLLKQTSNVLDTHVLPHDSLALAKEAARAILKQGHKGGYEGVFDDICARLEGRPDDDEAAKLCVELEGLNKALVDHRETVQAFARKALPLIDAYDVWADDMARLTKESHGLSETILTKMATMRSRMQGILSTLESIEAPSELDEFKSKFSEACRLRQEFFRRFGRGVFGRDMDNLESESTQDAMSSESDTYLEASNSLFAVLEKYHIDPDDTGGHN